MPASSHNLVRSQATEEVYETGPTSPAQAKRRGSQTSINSDGGDNGDMGPGEFGGAPEIDAGSLVPSAAQAARLFASALASKAGSSGAARGARVGAARTVRGDTVPQGPLDQQQQQQQQQQQIPTDTSSETPLQTLRRLLFETRELVGELLDAPPPAAQDASLVAAVRQTPANALRLTAANVDRNIALLSAQHTDEGGSQLNQAEKLKALQTHINNAKENRLPIRSSATPNRSYAGAVSYASAVLGAASSQTSPKQIPTSPRVSTVGMNSLSMSGAFSPLAQPSVMSPTSPSSSASPPVASPPHISPPTAGIPAPVSSSIQYDLYYQTGANPSNSTASNSIVFADDVLDIERRIGALERLVGNSAAGSTASSSLLDDIQDLDSTLTLLTTPHALARLSRRIQTITSQIDRTVRLRRRIMAQQQKQRRKFTSLNDDPSSSSDPDNDDETDPTASSPDQPATTESAVNQLIELEMESRRAEDERRVSYLFSTLSDRLDPMSTHIPQLLTRLRGLAMLNAEINSTHVRETLNELENEQNGVMLDKFEKVRNGMGRIRGGVRAGAKSGAKRFEEIEKGVRELVVAIEERFGNAGGRPVKPPVPPRKPKSLVNSAAASPVVAHLAAPPEVDAVQGYVVGGGGGGEQEVYNSDLVQPELVQAEESGQTADDAWND